MMSSLVYNLELKIETLEEPVSYKSARPDSSGEKEVIVNRGYTGI
jgi:hypothetical protein